jgi:hypothetical protein
LTPKEIRQCLTTAASQHIIMTFDGADGTPEHGLRRGIFTDCRESVGQDLSDIVRPVSLSELDVRTETRTVTSSVLLKHATRRCHQPSAFVDAFLSDHTVEHG